TTGVVGRVGCCWLGAAVSGAVAAARLTSKGTSRQSRTRAERTVRIIAHNLLLDSPTRDAGSRPRAILTSGAITGICRRLRPNARLTRQLLQIAAPADLLGEAKIRHVFGA